MKLTKEQFCNAVETYERMLNEEDELAQMLNVNPEWKIMEWIGNYYNLLSDLCELEESPYYGTDLDWFCYETDFGKRKDLNKVVLDNGIVWTIESPEILYDFIMREE